MKCKICGSENCIDHNFFIPKKIKRNEQHTFQPSFPFTLAIKDNCSDCKKVLNQIEAFQRDHLNYGNKMMITFHQDWWDGNIWHLANVEFRKYYKEE